MIDTKGLALLMNELNTLSFKNRLTQQEQRRHGVLLSQISLLKTGEVTLADLDQQMLDKVSREAGLPSSVISKSETRMKAEAWQALLLNGEKRYTNETQGSILARIGTYSGLGYFVPTEFIQQTYTAMAAHDALFDDNAVSVLNSKNGRVTEIPTYGDIENVASIMGEAADGSSSAANISAPGHATSGVYSFRSPMWRVPMEVVQDVEAMGGAVELFKAFAADRIVRGASQYLVNGTGSGQPLGLIPALTAAGVTPVSAVGSSDNTGGSETGTNSIGSQDIAKLYYNTNSAYRNAPKAAFFMNDSTLVYLAQLVNKMGNPLVQWQGSEAFIYGKPVRVCPSMDSIGASKYPVVFGDGAYWLTRKVQDDETYMKVFTETPGLAEQGVVGLRVFARVGGCLLWNDSGSPAPFSLLQNHS